MRSRISDRSMHAGSGEIMVTDIMVTDALGHSVIHTGDTFAGKSFRTKSAKGLRFYVMSYRHHYL